jgi:hypothetical protein
MDTADSVGRRPPVRRPLTGPARALVRRRPLLTFTILACILSWWSVPGVSVLLTIAFGAAVPDAAALGTWVEIPFEILFLLVVPVWGPWEEPGLRGSHSRAPPSVGRCTPLASSSG